MPVHGPIKCIFYSEFHPIAGPKITYQVPEEYVSKECFEAVHVYIITKHKLQNRVITVNALGHKIVGCPVCIDNPKYARNALIFNLCFGFDIASQTFPYETLVKKIAGYLTSLELECGFLSNEESRGMIPGILQQILTQLNNTGSCSIPINDSNTIHLKVFSLMGETSQVAAHDVPIFDNTLSYKDYSNWDMTTHRLLPYIDGFKHVARIAVEADVDINIVKACVQNLLFLDVVKITSIFQYSNVYTTAPAVGRLLEDEDLRDHCVQYVAKKGKKLPCIRDVFMLYCELTAGTTVRDLCARHNPHSLRVDERKLIQYGCMKGFIRRLHKYPVKLPGKAGGRQLQHLYKWFTGNHCYDEICCQTGYIFQDLDEQIESDPSIIICWK